MSDRPKLKIKRKPPSTYHVYVAVEEEGPSRYVKIGISTKPQQRFGSGTDNPRRVSLVGWRAFKDKDEALRVKRHLHHIYANWHKYGEWFGLGISDIEAFVSEILSCIESISADQELLEKLPRNPGAASCDPAAARWWLQKKAA